MKANKINPITVGTKLKEEMIKIPPINPVITEILKINLLPRVSLKELAIAYKVPPRKIVRKIDMLL